MRSQRYEILPRAQYRPASKMWVCIWRDPEDLRQTKGQPLRYVHEYMGIGETLDAALAHCRNKYINSCIARETAQKDIQRMLIPEHCIATSNLPWWKRIFRV